MVLITFWKLKQIWGDICTEVFDEDVDSFIGDTKFSVLKTKYNAKAYVPHIKPKNKSLSPYKAKYNKSLSNYRGNEERSFGLLRNQFQMFSTHTVFRGPLYRQRSYLLIAISIYNTQKRMRLNLPYDF